jgi:hypothetical protein
MTPAPLATRRLPLLGCALALAATLMLSACGGGGAATAGNTASAPATEKGVATAGREQCPASVIAFVASLDRLRRQLAVGLSYEQYAARVENLNRAYDALPVSRLTIGCVTATGTPAEDALNRYIDATNAWGKCLADASCTTATIEPGLQHKWRLASRSLSEVD